MLCRSSAAGSGNRDRRFGIISPLRLLLVPFFSAQNHRWGEGRRGPLSFRGDDSVPAPHGRRRFGMEPTGDAGSEGTEERGGCRGRRNPVSPIPNVRSPPNYPDEFLPSQPPEAFVGHSAAAGHSGLPEKPIFRLGKLPTDGVTGIGERRAGVPASPGRGGMSFAPRPQSYGKEGEEKEKESIKGWGRDSAQPGFAGKCHTVPNLPPVLPISQSRINLQSKWERVLPELRPRNRLHRSRRAPVSTGTTTPVILSRRPPHRANTPILRRPRRSRRGAV